MNYRENITQLIGNTPLVRINRLVGGRNLVLAKLEMFNPLSSVKDRIGLSMVEKAEKEGKIRSGSVIVEPTSGNTGIALAYICKVRGYRLILTMPETMSEERRRILKALGAEIVLTPGDEGMQGAINRALEIAGKERGLILQQFENPANPEIHKKTTAEEIWRDTEGKIDIFIAGVGTGGTITGVGEFLKKRKKNVQIVAVEPKESAVLSGETPGKHGIQGIGAGIIPKVLNFEIVDRIIKVSTERAKTMMKRLALQEGLFVGISSGAAMYATQIIDKEVEGKVIVVIFPDTGERYLSLWFDD